MIDPWVLVATLSLILFAVMSPGSIRVNAPGTTLLSAFSLCLPTHGLFDLVHKLRHVLGSNAPLLLVPSQHGFAGGEVDFIHLDRF